MCVDVYSSVTPIWKEADYLLTTPEFYRLYDKILNKLDIHDRCCFET